MKVTLKKATASDAAALLAMQKKAFWPLLEKYQDYGTSPAMETIERTQKRIADPSGGFFKIVADGNWAGAMCIRHGKEGAMWVGPIFVDSAFQGKGIAQHAMKKAENLFRGESIWKLSTLLEEQGNCYLYEKLGYVECGSRVPINDKATLIYYEKNVCLKEKDNHGLPETF
ncbi:GNAT family N-acetyltransferase [Planococcus koreensis]|uniref:GNAT family N-acetyltransferase n=1 Tax=Planococcus koreensis TaxID=112331 RepID=UPI0039FD1759